MKTISTGITETLPTFDYDRYIKKLSNKYGQNKFNQDLEQEGQLGLILARKKFNPSIGDFHKYAQWYIKGYMQKYLTQYSRLVKIPPKILFDKDNQFEDNQNSNISLSTEIDENKTYQDIYGPIQPEFEIKEINPIIPLLKQYVSQLKERYQLILNLRYNEEKTIEEIGDILGVSRQAVDDQLGKALSQLQKAFGVEQKRIKGERMGSDRTRIKKQK